MPARATMLDEIIERSENSIAEVVKSKCCFLGCKRDADYFLRLKFKTGATELYALCKIDLQTVKAGHPAHLERISTQGVFIYK